MPVSQQICPEEHADLLMHGLDASALPLLLPLVPLLLLLPLLLPLDDAVPDEDPELEAEPLSSPEPLGVEELLQPDATATPSEPVPSAVRKSILVICMKIRSSSEKFGRS